MKRFFSMAALVALTTGAAATQTMAATATAQLDANSAYVWRGLTANNGFVLQPSIDVAANGFDVNVWGNYDVADYHGMAEENRFSEVDLTASYAFKLGALDASVGVIEYTFPATNPEKGPRHVPSTAEVFAGLSYDIGAGFSVATKVYYDFEEADGFYATAGLGYTYSLNKKTTLGLNGLISYASEDFAKYYGGGTDSGFFNYLLTASAKYAVTDAFAVAANINYSDSMDHNVLSKDMVDTTVFGGVSLIYTF